MYHMFCGRMMHDGCADMNCGSRRAPPPYTAPASTRGCAHSREEGGGSTCGDAEGRPGTMIAHGDVAASTSRRHRCGYWRANCCANAPPQETPMTSTSR